MADAESDVPDGGAHPAAFRSALPATLCFIHFGRSRQREMETKKFLRLTRQDYGLFGAKICFKPHWALKRAETAPTAPAPEKKATPARKKTAAKKVAVNTA